MVAKMLVALVYGLLALVGAGSEYRVHDESSDTKTFRFSGDGIRTLDVRITNGSVRADEDDGNEVRLDVRKTIDADTDDDLRQAQREVVLDAADGSATIEVVVREPGRSACGRSQDARSTAWWDRRRYEVRFDLTLRVPRGTRLRLCTVNGEVQVGGASGDFDLSSVNGAITLDQMRGAGRAATVNGRVTATFATTPHEASLFKTVNGGIVATFPRDLSADLTLKTFNGGLFTDFDVLSLPRQAAPTTQRRAGRFVYRSDRFTSVRVGRGGPELTFESFNGDVRVLRAMP